MSVAVTSARDAFNGFACFRKRDEASDRRETKLLASNSVAYDQIARDTVELSRLTIRKRGNAKSSKYCVVEKSFKELEENVTFYEASEKYLKGKFVRVTVDSRQVGKFFDRTRAQVVDSQ